MIDHFWLTYFLKCYFQVGLHEAQITFASYYANSMVLQEAPARAVIWGYGAEASQGQTVTVTFNGKRYTSILKSGMFITVF